jgi:DNA-binding CsgD family transcriptional regulator/tetratricopeptide (TPR) repeat protein
MARTLADEASALLERDVPLARLQAARDDAARGRGSPPSPVVLVMEDLHWADDATRDLVVFLARRVHDLPVAVVLTARDDELDRDHPTTAALGRLASSDQPERMTLQPLGRASVEVLAPARDPDEVMALTGGNPFFVTELSALEAGIPGSVRAAVLARAAGLSPAARHLLDAASLVAEPAEIELVMSAADARAGCIDECVTSGALVASRGRVAFRHELARQAVADAIPPAAAARLHARLLEWLSARPGTDPARLAHHADHAGDERTFRFAMEAAARASRAGAHRVACRQYVRAIEWSRAQPPETVARAWEAYARECYAIADFENELAATHAALEMWRIIADPDAEAGATAASARALWNLGRGEDARRSADDALMMFEDRPASARQAEALATVAHLRMLARDLPRAIDLSERAARMAAEFDQTRTLVTADRVLGTSLWFVDPARASAPLERSIRLARRLGDDIAVAQSLVVLGSAAGEVRAYDVAESTLLETKEWCRSRDLDMSLSYATAWLARVEFERGRWDAAAAAAASVQDAPSSITRIVAHTVLGSWHARRGDAEAGAYLDEAWRLSVSTGDLQRLWPAAAARAEAAWLRGEGERVPELVAPTYALAKGMHQEWAIGELAWWLDRAGALDETPRDAAAPYAAALRGDPDEAARLWRALGCPYEEATACAESEDPADRVRALRMFHRLGAWPAADALAAALRRQDVSDLPRRPRRSTASNPHGLTDRQLEIAHLVEQGATDAEIAARLHISVKTAGHHVSAILTKLGLASRRDIDLDV